MFEMIYKNNLLNLNLFFIFLHFSFPSTFFSLYFLLNFPRFQHCIQEFYLVGHNNHVHIYAN